MGIFTLTYETEIKPRLELAISNALENEVKDAALYAIKDSAITQVYMAYKPKFFHRRYSLVDDDSYKCEIEGNRLTITYTGELQNLYGSSHGEDLGDVIAQGWDSFHMPFPRPWMDEGIENNIPLLENALKSGLERQGF
jgi:hypothetical protein